MTINEDEKKREGLDLKLYEDLLQQRGDMGRGTKGKPRKFRRGLWKVGIFGVALVLIFGYFTIFAEKSKIDSGKEVLAQTQTQTQTPDLPQVGLVAAHGLKVWEKKVFDSYDMEVGQEASSNETITKTIDKMAGVVAEEGKSKAESFISEVVSGNVSLSYASNGSIHRNPEAKKMVALTFDDGPFTNITSQYLEVLAKHDVKATFFTLGQYVKNRPAAAKKIAEAGHDIGSHSWYHHNLPKLSANDLREDFRKTDEAFQEVLGFSPYLFRAPYGAINHDIRAMAKEYNKLSVMWSLDPVDWKTKNPDKVYNQIMSTVKSGDIILLHENKATTLQVLPKLIEGLQEKGYKLVTVSELLYQSSEDVKNPNHEDVVNDGGVKVFEN